MAVTTKANQVALARIPAYPFAEVARYLRVPYSTVRSWAKGGSGSASGFRPVLDQAQGNQLTFAELTEMMIVRELRQTFFVPLQQIRNAKAYVAKALDRPWYLYDLGVAGRDIFIRGISNSPVAASRGGQLALEGFLDQVIQRVSFDTALEPSAIFPVVPYALDDKPVQIRPSVAFGLPTVTGTGVRTEIIFARVNAGEEVQDVAEDYDLTTVQIEDAVRFHALAA